MQPAGRPAVRILLTADQFSLMPQASVRNHWVKICVLTRPQTSQRLYLDVNSHRNCVRLTRLTRASNRFDSLARSTRSNLPQCFTACFTAGAMRRIDSPCTAGCGALAPRLAPCRTAAPAYLPPAPLPNPNPEKQTERQRTFRWHRR